MQFFVLLFFIENIQWFDVKTIEFVVCDISFGFSTRFLMAWRHNSLLVSNCEYNIFIIFTMWKKIQPVKISLLFNG